MVDVRKALWAVLATVPLASAAEIDFERDIATLLSKRCLSCHAGPDAEAELDLTNRDDLLRGGKNGPALVSGDPEASLIWQRVAADEMPEDQPLSPRERRLLKHWILQGAPWGKEAIDPYQFSTESRAGYDWWSLQPLRDPPLPMASGPTWARNAIDRFVLAKLQEKDLVPAPQAAPRQLVRRVVLDLTGLPPTEEMLDQLAGQPNQGQASADAYERLVDQLLASPRYGQKWARHWLDIVRFGESHGFEYNQPRDHAWWYRNWIIDAFNADLAYDEFVRQQVAGDVHHPQDPQAWAAVGFLVAGPHNTTKPSSQKMQMTMRHDELEDIVGAIGQTFLGLTVNCARCHDHKFDPISQREYYQLVATVAGIDHGERELPDPRASSAKRALASVQAQLKRLQEKRQAEQQQQQQQQQTKTLSEPSHGTVDSELATEISALKEQAKKLQGIRGPLMYTAISGKAPQIARLRRGDVSLPAEVVKPAGLRCINASMSDFQLEEDASDAERRQKLAAWLTGDQNPILARVIVNRLWHYHFGQGLVRTPSDFGFNGDRPSHPDLMEFLARELVRHDWNLKPIQRLMVTSATYRQSSRRRAAAIAIDAENRWLWRMTPRRLTAEEIRDAMLAISGQLVDDLGGPGYRDVREYKYRGSHYYDLITPQGIAAVRRTVYRFSPRGAKRTILDTFDCPDPSTKAPKRAVTTTPLQALSLMNNRFVFQMAAAWAKRLQHDSPDNEDAVLRLYRQAYARTPDADELANATAFIRAHDLASFCRIVFNSNEFLYVR